MRFMLSITRQIWLPLFWVVLVLVLLTLPGSAFPTKGVFGWGGMDKYLHIFLFGNLTWWFCCYSTNRSPFVRARLNTYFTIYVLVVAFGIALEYVQYFFVPNRDFEVPDIAADLIGASLAYGLANITLSFHEQT
jgi:hypothetical protein